MSQEVGESRIRLSTTEAMELSGLSREHIQRLLRTKKIEGVKPAHDWFVYKDSLIAFMSQPRRTGPKSKNQHEHTSQEISESEHKSNSVASS